MARRPPTINDMRGDPNDQRLRSVTELNQVLIAMSGPNGERELTRGRSTRIDDLRRPRGGGRREVRADLQLAAAKRRGCLVERPAICQVAKPHDRAADEVAAVNGECLAAVDTRYGIWAYTADARRGRCSCNHCKGRLARRSSIGIDHLRCPRRGGRCEVRTDLQLRRTERRQRLVERAAVGQVAQPHDRPTHGGNEFFVSRAVSRIAWSRCQYPPRDSTTLRMESEYVADSDRSACCPNSVIASPPPVSG
jgi:hypothetical protein